MLIIVQNVLLGREEYCNTFFIKRCFYLLKKPLNDFYVIIYTKLQISMQWEQKQGRSKRQSTEYSSDSSVWSQEHQVYYYSKFELFESKESEEEFYQFTIFLQKVSSELGKEWKKQANHLYYPHFTSREVFMSLMELWLSHHPPVNSHRFLKAKQTTFNPSYLTEFKAKIQDEYCQKHSGVFIQPPNISIKAVCLGFFMTANQIWQDMFQKPQLQPVSFFSPNNFFKTVTTSLQKTFRPLMVVTQKISSVFGRKKRKHNQQVNIEESTQSKFQNCYHQFKRTLDMEKQLERKMSDLNLEDEQKETSKIIEKKEFLQSQSPIQSSIIGNLYSYVTQFLNKNPSWQVASNFVTQILDLNQIELEGKRVKVMRPAQDFYRKLVLVWLMLQKNEESQVTFAVYFSKLKSTFFPDNWQDKYIVPTKYFFERMKQNWEDIKKQNNPEVVSDKEVLDAFIRRIKITMKNQWETKIKMKQERKSTTVNKE